MTQTLSAPATYAATVSDLCAALIDTLIDNLIALQPYAIAAAAAALCIRSITRATLPYADARADNHRLDPRSIIAALGAAALVVSVVVLMPPVVLTALAPITVHVVAISATSLYRYIPLAPK